MSFFNRFKLELEDLNEELIGLPLEITNCRVVDIGCGMGYKTLGLLLKLQASECIGIDKFIGDWSSPALDEVQQKFDGIKEFILKEHNKLRDDSLKRELWELFSRGRHPIFQKGDIVEGDKLPSNLDLVYCKKVLGNVFTGEYNNLLKGEIGVSTAIANIATMLKNGGLLCLVEKDVMRLVPFLEAAGLSFLRVFQIRQGEIEESGRSTSSIKVSQYFIYHYRKL